MPAISTKIIEWSSRRIHARDARPPGHAVVQRARAEQPGQRRGVDAATTVAATVGREDHEHRARHERHEERPLVDHAAQARLDGAEAGQRRVGRGVHQRICMPEIARAITSRWISEVPSKIV